MSDRLFVNLRRGLPHRGSSAGRFVEWAETIWQPKFERHFQQDFDRYRAASQPVINMDVDRMIGLTAAAIACELLTAYPQNDHLRLWRRPLFNHHENLVGFAAGPDLAYMEGKVGINGVGADDLDAVKTAYTLAGLNVPAEERVVEEFTADDIEALPEWKDIAVQIERESDPRNGAWG